VISWKISGIFLKSVQSEVFDKGSKGFSETSQFLDIMMKGIEKIKNKNYRLTIGWRREMPFFMSSIER